MSSIAESDCHDPDCTADAAAAAAAAAGGTTAAPLPSLPPTVRALQHRVHQKSNQIHQHTTGTLVAATATADDRAHAALMSDEMDVTGLANEDRNSTVPSIERSSPDPLTQPMPPYEIGAVRAVTQFTSNTSAPATIPSSVPTGPEKRTSSDRNSIHQTPPRLAPAMNVNLAREKTRPGPSAFLSLYHSPQDAVEVALGFLVHAASIADIQERRNLLTLVEIFRDYTEKGRVPKNAATIIASQVSNLENVSRSLGSKVQALKKPPPPPAVPTETTVVDTREPPTTQVNATAPPRPSYAATAAKNNPSSSNWQTVGKKTPTKPKQPKTGLNERQLVLTRAESTPFDPLKMRNAFNKAFSNRGLEGPVITSVTASRNGNMVLTTTTAFDAKFLLEKIDIWRNVTNFVSAQPIQSWHKVAIHNIPSNYTNDELSILKSEIKTFNTGMTIVGNPYWLSSEANRREKVAGSVCIAFATEQEAQQAIRKPLYLLGISVRAEKIHSTPPTTQCAKCQGFGHTDKRCRKATACKLCAEPHPTAVHKCNTCGAKAKKCAHTIPKCANCKEAHSADHRECEVFLAVKKPTQDANSKNVAMDTE